MTTSRLGALADVHGNLVALDRLEASGHPEVEHIASFQRGEQIPYPSRRPHAPTNEA